MEYRILVDFELFPWASAPHRAKIEVAAGSAWGACENLLELMEEIEDRKRVVVDESKHKS